MGRNWFWRSEEEDFKFVDRHRGSILTSFAIVEFSFLLNHQLMREFDVRSHHYVGFGIAAAWITATGSLLILCPLVSRISSWLSFVGLLTFFYGAAVFLGL